MERYTELEALHQAVWAAIAGGASEAQHPYRTPTLGTLGPQGPHLRTIVLREVALAERVLWFHADRRSQKVRDLQTQPQVAWHFWDPESRLQLRLQGEATLHWNDAWAEWLWQRSPARSLQVYCKPMPPGTMLETPQSGLVPGDVSDGRPHFAAILTRASALDVLHLHPQQHYRAWFRYSQAGTDSRWIVP